ncbi:MAG: ribonuclease PH [Verrucomicrobia bacterium GWF2_51_19]|nr:MAG: ribonuclease PH [Verrucomicrobia bacterium GWF2_51_19]HCJ12506.1 ribonuclease PH [Opitutae bacterium]
MEQHSRAHGREHNALRPITFQPNIAPNASGSVLVRFGNTQVICAITLEKKLPKWMLREENKTGWLSAEYSMLPYSTLERKQRDISKGKLDGRTVEIQRLIGRSLRAVVDLKALNDYTLWIDCDVLQADGGTRTASISGAYVAASLAFRKLLQTGSLAQNPLKSAVAAVSVGILNNQALLDLDYLEDKDAAVDFNVVMTDSGQFVEIQGSGEESTFSEDQHNALLGLAKSGIRKILQLQQEAIASATF